MKYAGSGNRQTYILSVQDVWLKGSVGGAGLGAYQYYSACCNGVRMARDP